MKFLFPTFLFALLAIAIPIIIHLFNFRKFKKVYFTNVKFLKEVKQETQSKSKLKHLLVLCSRILAIIFLVFAFAQPFIPSENTSAVIGDKAISVYVDNSFSMMAESEQGNLFEESRKRAREIADAFKPSDKFQLITNDFEARHQRLVNKEEFLILLDEISISPAVKKISEIISRQQDLLLKQSELNKFAFLISDFQKPITDVPNWKNDSLVKVRMLPVTPNRGNNLYIDSCWFESPVIRAGQNQELKVRIKNASDIPYENISGKLLSRGKQKAPASLDIESNSSEIISMPFTIGDAGLNQGVVKITDFPITYDDDFFFSFYVDPNLPILIINGEKESPYFKSLFGKDDYFILNNVSEKNIDFSQFQQNKLIVLNELKTISSGLAQELKKFTGSGGTMLVVPSKDIDLESYKTFLIVNGINHYTTLDTADAKVIKINTSHQLLKNVFEEIPDNLDLPVSQAHYRLGKSSRSGEEEIIKLQNGDAFLSKFPAGKGAIYLSAVPFSEGFSNFPKHALFVPVMYNIALYSQIKLPIFYTTGRDEIVENPMPGVKNEILKISGSNNFEIIPEQKNVDGKQQLIVHGQIKIADNFKLLSNNDTIAGLSFNFDRAESVLSYIPSDELLSAIETNGLSNYSILNPNQKEVGAALEELNLGRRLWKLCIIFALLFLLIEIALLRYYKN
jgi:hypothetical protein